MISVDEIEDGRQPTSALLTNELGERFKIGGFDLAVTIDNLESITKGHILRSVENKLDIAEKNNEDLRNELMALKVAYQRQAERLKHQYNVEQRYFVIGILEG